MAEPIPAAARAVIIGGGIVGCSVAYHLAALGWKDIVLLEQGQLSCGTTWHAAGLVGQLRAQESMTRLIRYSTQLYAQLETATGLGTGWQQCGSLAVARTRERMVQLKRTAAVARAYGVECEIVSPSEAGRLWPQMRTDDLVGGVWLPADGKANPSDLTQALARGARSGGTRIFERTRVTAIATDAGTVRGVTWRSKDGATGDIAAEVVINCAGQWAKVVGQMGGVTVPLHSAEHYYIVTGKIEGVNRELPVLRDPDGYVYFKEEVGGLVMGGFEPDAKPWGMQGIPEAFEFQLLPDDWDQFQILMENAIARVPALATCEVKQFYNGPESFTPDNNFILGEAPELRHFYVAAGFNSMGIASAGGGGKALAEWIVNGDPTMDLWPVDIRRFARWCGNERFLHDRVKETLGLHYAMPWPNRELDTARPLRRSPLYHLLRERGACFGSKMGWERANWFARAGEAPAVAYSFGRQNWFDASAAEHRAARETVAIFDLGSFAKYLVTGRDAEATLQYLCANDVAIAPGRTVYTGMLNDRGGYESDLTVTRLARDEFLIVTGSAQATRDLDFIRRHIPAGAHAVIVDVTSLYSVLAVVGPAARLLLQQVSPADMSNAAFPFGASREIDVGYATVRATRMSYAGELGWELTMPADFAVTVYETLVGTGASLGLTHAGYYALDSLRIEKAYRAWGRELSPDYTPLEAGLGFAVKFGRAIAFRGRDALLAQKARGVSRRLAAFTLDNPAAILWGGELIFRNGEPAGQVTSAAYGHTLGRAVALGYVRNTAGNVDAAFMTSGKYSIDVGGECFDATIHWRAPYDPDGARLKS